LIGEADAVLVPVGHLCVDEILFDFLGVPEVDPILESPDDALLAVDRGWCVSFDFSQIILEPFILCSKYRGFEESAGDGI